MVKDVVCVDTSDDVALTIGKPYEVVHYLKGYGLVDQVQIENDRGDLVYYKLSRFISLRRYRLKELKEIKNANIKI